ncbi:MAG: GNAT family N-acetyltransferase [Aeromicrobium sp.]
MIETVRLVLRFFTHADADRLYDMFRRPEVARWSGNGKPMTERDQAVQRIARMPERAGDHPAAGVFAAELKDTGVVAGMVMLVPIPPSKGVDRSDMEIGWHFHPDAWGNGYATEAATALVERGFAAGIPELYAVTDLDNAASQAVCRRLSMEDIGTRSDWYDMELRAFCLKGPGEPVN